MSDQKETVIREQRTNLAIRNNLMGHHGKLAVILRAYGSEIVRQGGGMFETDYLEDFDDMTESHYSPMLSDQKGPLMYREEIATDEIGMSSSEGLIFDGLSRGMHLEIIHNSKHNRLTVTYQGHLVYEETAGQLYAYAPSPDWEGLVDRLHRSAKDKMKKEDREIESLIKVEVEKNKAGFWERMRSRWGI